MSRELTNEVIAELCAIEESLAAEFDPHSRPASLSHMERGWLPGEFTHRRSAQSDHDPVVTPGSVSVPQSPGATFAWRFTAECSACSGQLIGRRAVPDSELSDAQRGRLTDLAEDMARPLTDAERSIEQQISDVREAMAADDVAALNAKGARGAYLLKSDMVNLNTWAAQVGDLFGGEKPYLVGSATRTAAYRDVDVRVIMDDEHFERLDQWLDLAVFEHALSIWGKQVTWLPIDLQLQSMSQVNGGDPQYDGIRHPLGMDHQQLGAQR